MTAARPVFLRGKILRNFLIAMLMMETIPGQTPLNGFCIYNKYPVQQGYTSFSSLNYNDDAYTDLLLFGANKSMTLYKGGKGGELTKERTFQLQADPVAVLNLRQKSFSGERLFVLTPDKRKGEVSVITPGGQMYVQHTVRLNEYPKFAASDELNDDGTPDILLSGINASGISVYIGEGRLYKFNKINKGESFQYVTPIDWNADGYPDITAFEPFKQMIYLFSNNSRGNFRFERAFSAGMNVTGIHSYDMDLDGFQDIVVKSDERITIYYGDAAGSYLRKTDVPAAGSIYKLAIGDYNRDGFIDIVTLSKTDGRVSVYFQKEGDAFHAPVMLYAEEKITDINNYYSRFVDGIALLDSSGYIHTITRGGSPADQAELVTGGKPTLLASFDQGHNGIKDLMYIDADNTSLKILLRDKSGVPSLLYSRLLSFLPDVLILSDENPDVKRVILHKKGERFAEVITAALGGNSFKRTLLFVDGKIEDIRFVNTAEKQEIAVIINRSGMLTYKRFALGAGKPEVTFETELGVGITRALTDKTGNIYMIKNSGLISEIQYRNFTGQENTRMLYRIESRYILPETFYIIPLATGGDGFCGLVTDDEEHSFVAVNEILRIQISNRRASEAASRVIRQKTYIPLNENGKPVQTYFMTGNPKEIVIWNLSVNPVKSLARKYRRATEIEDFVVVEFKERQPYFIHSTSSGLLNFRKL